LSCESGKSDNSDKSGKSGKSGRVVIVVNVVRVEKEKRGYGLVRGKGDRGVDMDIGYRCSRG
jgi:hypothetical protein